MSGVTSIHILQAHMIDVARAPEPALLPEGAPSATKCNGRRGRGGRRPKTSIGAAQVVDEAPNLEAYAQISAEVGRVFSSSKRTITDRRACLAVDIIQACECLNDWEAAKIFRDWTM
jgi:hypothetical protein